MTTTECAAECAPDRPVLRLVSTDTQAVSFFGTVRRTAFAVIDLLLTWQERANQRFHLQQMSDHMLKDLGISRADVHLESSKPFWRH